MSEQRTHGTKRSGDPLKMSSDKPVSSGDFKRPQKTLISRMKEELGGATFDSEGLFDDIYPPIPSFDPDAFFSGFMKNFSPSFPSSSIEELFYLPLARLLNTLHRHMEQQKLLSNSIYEGVRFEAYNKKMTDSPGDEEPLKPDLIARIPSSNRASWQEVEFFVEVKSDFPALVAQAATYARAVFGLQRNRLFVLALFFEHTTLEISFGIFHPLGLIFPKQRYKLNDQRGYREFILTMARVYASPQRRGAGFDDSSNNQICHIPEYGTYLYNNRICYRNTVRGRQTRVDEMELFCPPTPQFKPDSSHSYRSITGPYLQFAITTTSSQSGTVSRLPLPPLKLSQKDIPPPLPKKIKLEPQEADLLPAHLPLVQSYLSAVKDAPKSLILKDSWPLFSRWDMESRMFEAVKDTFGIPCVGRAYQVSDREVDLLASRGDLQKRNMWGYAGADPEPRVRVRLPILTKGLPLTEAKSPRALVLGVVHAMVGHWHLLRAGWLHRDVNIGNVLLRKVAVKDLTINDLHLTDESWVHFSECTSFITDGDLAVQWQSEGSSFCPSGTLPFMSFEMILTACQSASRPSSYTQTAVDDLESFVWVLVWAILERVPKQTWTALETSMDGWFHSDTIHGLLGKRVFLSLLVRAKRNGSIVGDDVSAGLEVFLPLLIDWLTETENAAASIRSAGFSPVDALNFYRRVYQKYITLAVKFIDKLPENWNYMDPGASAGPSVLQ